MAESKVCPKCKGTMVKGRIIKFTESSVGNRYLYVWEPDNGSSSEISKDSSGKAMSKLSIRKGLAVFCCNQCGFVEIYGVAEG